MKIYKKKDIEELKNKLSSARKNAEVRKLRVRASPTKKNIIASIINFLLY